MVCSSCNLAHICILCLHIYGYIYFNNIWFDCKVKHLDWQDLVGSIKNASSTAIFMFHDQCILWCPLMCFMSITQNSTAVNQSFRPEILSAPRHCWWIRQIDKVLLLTWRTEFMWFGELLSSVWTVFVLHRREQCDIHWPKLWRGWKFREYTTKKTKGTFQALKDFDDKNKSKERHLFLCVLLEPKWESDSTVTA